MNHYQQRDYGEAGQTAPEVVEMWLEEEEEEFSLHFNWREQPFMVKSRYINDIAQVEKSTGSKKEYISWNVASNKIRLWWPTDVKSGPPSKSEGDKCQVIESWCAANATVRRTQINLHCPSYCEVGGLNDSMDTVRNKLKICSFRKGQPTFENWAPLPLYKIPPPFLS